jgi:RNA polymerase subunit RPABC4/transcription elongation factor Spt4
LVKLEELLEPGETLIKEGGGGAFTQVTWVKSLANNIQGRLVLTDRRLFFVPGNFQNTDATMLVALRLFRSPDSVSIPLGSITKVEKGWGEQLGIYTDKKYDFRGMRGAGDWQKAIEQARATPQPQAPRVQAAPQQAAPRKATPPPPPAAAGSSFCNNCGRALRPQDKFCPGCGTKAPDSGPATCPSCGGEVEADQKFCNSCGAKLK